MATAVINNFDVLSELRHSIMDLVYSISDPAKLQKMLDSVKSQPKYSEQVSPSGDEWFDDPENIKMLDERKAEADRGEVFEMSMDEIKEALKYKPQTAEG